MPWCPKCGYEYKEGYLRCSDCDCELVESLDAVADTEDNIIRPAFGNNFSTDNEEPDMYIDETDLDNGSEAEDTDTLKQIKITKKRLDEPVLFVEAATRAEEYKSGALILLAVGIIGLTAVILSDLGVISFLAFTSKILLNLVMGGLFLVFIVMGIFSVRSYKRLKLEAVSEEKLTEDIKDYFKNNISEDDLIVENSLNFTKEEIVLNQYERIKAIITEKFGSLDDSYLEYITEKVYVIMFE